MHACFIGKYVLSNKSFRAGSMQIFMNLEHNATEKLGYYKSVVDENYKDDKSICKIGGNFKV